MSKSIKLKNDVYISSDAVRVLSNRELLTNELWLNGGEAPNNDLDQAVHNGCYYWFPSTNGKPAPDYGTILVFNSAGVAHNYSNNWCQQLAFGTQYSIYYRQKINSNSWGIWVQLH